MVPSGISTDVREVQPRKAAEPKETSEAGMLIVSRAVHSPKTLLPTEVTDVGIVKDVRELQPLKA